MKAIADKNHKDKGAWNGYTMAELEYQRALTLAKMEIQKEHFNENVERIRMGNFNMTPANFTRALGVLNYMDYIIMALRTIRRISTLFKKKK